jgi:hypothetical protein
MASEPAARGAVPEYVATPDRLTATVWVVDPIVNRTLPVGRVDPLAGVTVADSVYGEPTVSEPVGVVARDIVVPIAATVSFNRFDVLPEYSVEP